MENLPQKYTPPTLAEILEQSNSIEKAYAKESLNYLLSQQPPKDWVKKHPYIKDHLYLPIDKVEFLLRKIFKDYRIEITGQGTSFNGVWVTVRVHFLDPATGEWSFHDGIGAAQLQTKQGASPADMININNGAISMAYPIAKSLAIKDACDMFGNLFGANLNRRDIVQFTADEKIKEKVDKKQERTRILIERAKNLAELYPLKEDAYKQGLQNEYNQKANELGN